MNASTERTRIAAILSGEKPKAQPARTDENGLPFEPCPVCRDRFSVKRQEPGASWYCWSCLGKGDEDPLTYRDAAGNMQYLHTCSFGSGWQPAH